jgi:antitoxin YefM
MQKIQLAWVELDFLYAILYTQHMKTLSSTDLRANLSSVMDRINDDHEPVIVTRAKGKPVVMVSLEDWASMDETTYLLASPANRAALLGSIEAGLAGKVVVKTMDELLAFEAE